MLLAQIALFLQSCCQKHTKLVCLIRLKEAVIRLPQVLVTLFINVQMYIFISELPIYKQFRNKNPNLNTSEWEKNILGKTNLSNGFESNNFEHNFVSLKNAIYIFIYMYVHLLKNFLDYLNSKRNIFRLNSFVAVPLILPGTSLE